MSETKAKPSDVRQGLALICMGAIAVVIGYAGNDSPSPFDVIGDLVTMGGYGAALLGLAYVAYGLLHD